MREQKYGQQSVDVVFLVIVEIYLLRIGCFRFNVSNFGERDISSRSPVLDKSSYSRFVSMTVAISFLHLCWIFTGVSVAIVFRL